MKILTTFTAAVFMMASLQVNSQDALPKGFVKGTITLADNSEITGYIKENIRNKAAVTMITGQDEKKITYDGDRLNSVTIEDTKYICIKGDFFKLLCDGDLSFLQKSSDASSKPLYNGTEAIFINRTTGKPGDYFIFNKGLQQLQLVNNKNVAEVTAQVFTNCETAISKAKQSGSDIALLKDAVEAYNNRNR